MFKMFRDKKICLVCLRDLYWNEGETSNPKAVREHFRGFEGIEKKLELLVRQFCWQNVYTEEDIKRLRRSSWADVKRLLKKLQIGFCLECRIDMERRVFLEREPGDPRERSEGWNSLMRLWNRRLSADKQRLINQVERHANEQEKQRRVVLEWIRDVIGSQPHLLRKSGLESAYQLQKRRKEEWVELEWRVEGAEEENRPIWSQTKKANEGWIMYAGDTAEGDVLFFHKKWSIQKDLHFSWRDHYYECMDCRKRYFFFTHVNHDLVDTDEISNGSMDDMGQTEGIFLADDNFKENRTKKVVKRKKTVKEVRNDNFGRI